MFEFLKALRTYYPEILYLSMASENCSLNKVDMEWKKNLFMAGNYIWNRFSSISIHAVIHMMSCVKQNVKL